MILEFSLTNFYSFKEENTVSFIVNKKSPCNDAYVETKHGERVAKILACFGPNASGKTNLLKVLPFLSWFIRNSFNLKPDDLIPFEPFRFEKDNSIFCVLTVHFEYSGKIHRYLVRLTPEQVIDESLFIREDKGFKYLFKRQWNEVTKKFDFVTKDFGLTPAFGEFLQMRKNASVLSIALQHNHESSKQIAQYWLKVTTNVHEQGREDRLVSDEMIIRILESAEYFYKHPEFKMQVQKFLTRFDLGLAGIEIEEREVGIDKEGKPKKLIIPFGIHVGKDESTHKLPFFNESNGTQNLFVLLKRILPILEVGGIAVIDEFEVDLHPHMIPLLVNLFTSLQTNPHHAQLLFSCHSIELMKSLDKYQILLVEKDEYGYSRAIRMDEIKGVRSDENIYAKYDAGAYGAVPNI